MVNSRDKGIRGEYLVRDLLREHTNLQFERTPVSGALSYLKGDLYVPHKTNRFCIEVKNYAETPLTDKIFTQPKTNDLIRWWNKLQIQAESCKQEPLLFYKYNRSKIFVCTNTPPKNIPMCIHLHWLDCYVMLAEEWLKSEDIRFLEQ